MSDTLTISRRPRTAADASPGRVLIIDDEASIRESLQTLLELEGYNVTCSETGDDGLQAVAHATVDVVLLDLALPGMSGMEVLQDLRAHDPNITVVMITAYGTVENAVLAVQNGANNFIQKPWDNDKLLADVANAVARHRAE